MHPIGNINKVNVSTKFSTAFIVVNILLACVTARHCNGIKQMEIIPILYDNVRMSYELCCCCCANSYFLTICSVLIILNVLINNVIKTKHVVKLRNEFSNRSLSNFAPIAPIKFVVKETKPTINCKVGADVLICFVSNSSRKDRNVQMLEIVTDKKQK